MSKYRLLMLAVVLVVFANYFAYGCGAPVNCKYDIDNRQWSKDGVHPNWLNDANGQKINTPICVNNTAPSGYVFPQYSSKYCFTPTKTENYGDCSRGVKCQA